MTTRDQVRQEEQRRITDIINSYEQERMTARIQLMGILLVACTFFGGVIGYISVAAAKEEVKPINDKQIRIETRVDAIESTICEIKDGQKEMLVILRQISTQ